MKRRIKILVLGLIIAVFLIDAASAGSDSLTIQVSCSIPAVPGLNVPLLTEETLRLPDTDLSQETEEDKQEKETIFLAENDGSEVVVKTLYVR